MSDAPWVKFYPSDWLGGTRGLTATETGIYIGLIALMYDHGAPLHRDDLRLARRCGATPRQFTSALNLLIKDGKIILVDGGLWNSRVASELHDREARICKAKQAGQASQKAKTKENQRSLSALEGVKSAPSGTILELELERRIVEEEKNNLKVVPKEKRGCRLPDDFEPDATCIATAEKMLMTAQRSQLEFEKFKNHWKAKAGKDAAKLDWQATFRNWLLNAKGYSHGHVQANGHKQNSIAGSLAIASTVVDEYIRRAEESEGSRKADPEPLSRLRQIPA